MKREMKLVAAAAAILAGCASGGGGRTDEPSGLDEAMAALVCVYSLRFACPRKTAKSSGSSRSASAYLSADDYLSGRLSYAPGSNTLSGTLTSASGTMSGASNGQFYGPKAKELGGVFVVKSPSTVETFTGACGAKR